jgi:hypothetical protein
MAADRGQWDGLQRLKARLGRLTNVDEHDRAELAMGLAEVMIEDNRAGVLAGLDRNGNPAPALTYRGGAGKRTPFRRGSDAAYGLAARGVRRDRSKAGMLRFKGLSSYTFTDSRFRQVILPNNNLATWKYQELTGPRLAPRRDASRVISNYKPKSPMYEWNGRVLTVICGWVDVVSAKGVPFLQAHFKGEHGLPKYDLAGVRPIGKRKAVVIVRAWAKNLLGIR